MNSIKNNYFVSYENDSGTQVAYEEYINEPMMNDLVKGLKDFSNRKYIKQIYIYKLDKENELVCIDYWKREE